MVAKRIRVLKGVSSLQYPGSNLGSVVLIEPSKINREPHLHGEASAFFEKILPARRANPGKDLFSRLCQATDEEGNKFTDQEKHLENKKIDIQKIFEDVDELTFIN